jgi:hypothetical protein
MSQKTEDGLLLRGTVVARKRREAKQGDRTRFCLTLFVRTAVQTYQVDRWADSPLPQGTPEVNEKVEMPITVGAYLSHGMAMARLSWGSTASGSDF